jgi:hypothetical protein
MRDISFVVFTNEKYFKLLYLTLPYTIENTKHLGKTINVVSNKIPEHDKFDGVNYIDPNVNFSSTGSHFRDSLLMALNQIPEDYILFLCDDYLIKSPINKNRFDNLVNIMEKINGDFLALGTQKHIENFVVNWNRPEIKLSDYGFPDDCFYEFDETARHMYSVQPCIWKKSSLIELLNHNPGLTLHQLDNTDILNKRREKRNLIEKHSYLFYESKENFFDYGFKNFCYHFPPLTNHVDEKPMSSDFLLIDYIEIVRHGKFLNAEVNSKTILYNILNSEENTDLKDKLKDFLN